MPAKKKTTKKKAAPAETSFTEMLHDILARIASAEAVLLPVAAATFKGIAPYVPALGLATLAADKIVDAFDDTVTTHAHGIKKLAAVVSERVAP